MPESEDEDTVTIAHGPGGRREVAEHRHLIKQAHRRSRQAVFDQIRTLRDAGNSIGDIARETGFGPRSIRKWLKFSAPPDRRATAPKPCSPSYFLDYLSRRWAEGCVRGPAARSRRRDKRVDRGLEQRPNRRAYQSIKNPQARHVGSRKHRTPTGPDVAALPARRPQSLRKTPFKGSDLLLVQAVGQGRMEPPEIARGSEIFRPVGHEVELCGPTRADCLAFSAG